MDERLIIIKTKKEIYDLIDYLKDKDFVAFDVETTGVERGSHIIGYSVAAELDKAFYVINSYWNVATKTLVDLETIDATYEFMQFLTSKSLVLQNASFDCAMVENNYKVKLMPSVHTDTLVLGHLLNENRANGLKERGIELYGENAAAEQKAMQESVYKNGGVLTKEKYELYKADPDLIAHYGAKDAILTLKIFYHDVEILMEEGLDKFFYDDETMPLLRGPTYDMNTTGLRVDPERLQDLHATLTAECAEAQSFILQEIAPHIKTKYPGDKKTNHFNIKASQQLAWLLFYELEQEFGTLTEGGKELCEALNTRVPYTMGDKRAFIQTCVSRKGEVWAPGHLPGKEHVCTPICFDKKTGKKRLAKKIKDPWQYLACDESALSKYSKKYKWVEKLLQYKKNQKLLSTYVEGIQSRMRYNIIRPNFLQHGTTSGRYSCKNPNFQNLPRDDKRIKSCIVSRPGKVFVGADHSQLEPRVFASVSGDKRLQESFSKGEDFYSVIGVEVYSKPGCSLKKDDKNSFAKLFPAERQYSKQFGLAGTYGATPHRLAKITGQSQEDMKDALDAYFERFPDVRKFMLSAHEEAKTTGQVLSLFGRPRRMPVAKSIPVLFGKTPAEELPYEYRNLLNLSVNHKIQSSGSSIMNRGAIKVWNYIKELSKDDKRWNDVKIVLQVHDQLVLEGPQELADEMKIVLKDGLETAVILPGVNLEAEPFESHDLAGQK